MFYALVFRISTKFHICLNVSPWMRSNKGEPGMIVWRPSVKQSRRQNRQKTAIRCDASHMNASDWFGLFLFRLSSHSVSQSQCTNLQNLVRLLRESCAGRRPRFRSGVAFIYDANAIVFRGLNGLRIMRDRHRKNFSTLLALHLFLSSIEKNGAWFRGGVYSSFNNEDPSEKSKPRRLIEDTVGIKASFLTEIVWTTFHATESSH